MGGCKLLMRINEGATERDASEKLHLYDTYRALNEQRIDSDRRAMVLPPNDPYGILRFDLCSKVVATVKPAAMLSNCPHPARMVLGPGGL